MFKVVALLAEPMADSKTQLVSANVLLCLREFGQDLYMYLDEHELLETSLKPKQIGDLLAIPFKPLHFESQNINTVRDRLGFDISSDSIELERVADSLNPHARLSKVIETWLSTYPKVDAQSLLSSLPRKWELLGDLVILPETAFESKHWKEIFAQISSTEKLDLWQQVTHALGGQRLARQHPIAKNEKRSSQTELLLGQDGWVEFLDHGIHFGFDATKVMFSSGNVTERRRIGMIDMQGEVVVDAFAGVGYYSLHMALRSKAEHIHACEINPDSIHGLTWACKANAVEQKITIHQGDNQKTLPLLYGQADRCHLGILPSSQPVWEHALRCLKSGGGWLHIHMNVHKNDIEQWQKSTIEVLQKYAQQIGHGWDISAHHLERVKWFSPHIWHVVLDVECRADTTLIKV
tara:strand:- start:4692 stop:5912 length:1221 start_codon:yes stop_codon:yes gene_type:complete